MFERLMSGIDSEIVHRIYKVQVSQGSDTSAGLTPISAGLTPLMKAAQNMRTNSQQVVAQPVVNTAKKLGRNDPCWCGSGKKWKKCHYPKAG